jgi:ferredoxin
MSDPFVITRLCRDCVDGACLDACPVDCIYEAKPDAGLPNQLFIKADDCICCAACEPACPWEAILEISDVPPELESDIELNALTTERSELFTVAKRRDSATPTLEEVEANKRRWSAAS